MAKTKPIGVRFNSEQLEQLKKDNIADSPQKALNYYESLHKITRQDENKPKLDKKKEKVENSVKNWVDENKEQIKGIVAASTIPEMPVKMEGENSIDFAVRKNEWKKKYGQL
jgi:hypothetical protein